MHRYFYNAFKGKTEKLSETLDVTDVLLRALVDKDVIDREHQLEIQQAYGKAKKVDVLLLILERRDDNLFSTFCGILAEKGQQHVVKMLCSNKLEVELEDILEPNYGLPSDLFYQNVITQKERDFVLGVSIVQSRVSNLLQVVKQKSDGLNDKHFLDVLTNGMQKHVAEFIKVNGDINSIIDDTYRPLNEQQRRRLFDPSLRTEVDLRNTELHYMMRRKQVVSLRQSERVTKHPDMFDGNEILLDILMRRSVADVKRFIVCLHNAGYSSTVDQLTTSGVIIRSRTVISSSKSLEEEIRVAEFFRLSDGRKMVLEFCQWWLPQAENEFKREFPEKELELDFEIFSIDLANSLQWHIMCRTLQTLENLRWFYFHGSYSKLLNAIFNRSLCHCYRENIEPFELHVEWTADDFEQCRSFFNSSRSQPFGDPCEWIEGNDDELRGISDVKVS